MYGIRGIINRCGVIAGPWQFGKVDQGVFTLWMLAHYFKRDNLKYIGFGGKGKQVRDLIHVNDIFELLTLQMDKIEQFSGKVYNVGGGCDISLSLRETTEICREITGNTIMIGKDHITRPADLIIYIGDNSKIREDAAWVPKQSPKIILEDIFSWIQSNEILIKRTLLQ